MGNNTNRQQQNHYRIMRLCANSCQTDQRTLKNDDEVASINQESRGQPVQNETLFNVSSKFDQVSWMSIRYKLSQGTTLVSSKPQQKYLVHYIKFTNLKEYQNFTNALLYRLKMLRSCLKSRKYFNQIIAIFTEKDYKVSCITSNSCASFNVYIVQNYLPHSLQDLFNDLKLSYNDIKCILRSFCQVMAAYQYKRLRFGSINFAHIYLTKLLEKTPEQTSKQIFISNEYSEIKIVNNSNTLSSFKQNSLDKTLQFQFNKDINNYYFCKVSDPYIRDFISNLEGSKSKQEEKILLSDTYKNDVLKVGTFLQEYIQEKEDHDALQRLRPQQEKIKSFLENLIQKHMTSSIQDRYNWLQIQRHFQEYNNNEKLFKTQLFMQGLNKSIPLIKTDRRYPDYPQNPYKSSSLEKNPIKTALHSHQSSDFVKAMADRNPNNVYSSFNKENILENNNSYITLKPSQTVKKYQITGSINNLNNQSNLMSNQDLKNILRAPGNVSIQNLNIQTTNYNHPNNNTSNSKNIQYRQQKPNSGYGVVQNQFPEKPDGKIQYNNLFNIGKAWTKFEGSFVDGCKEGPGTIYLTNGQIFTGFFVKDLANGKGSVYINGQLVLKGTWKNNTLVTQF